MTMRMIITEKIGNLQACHRHPQIDYVLLEWFETSKRILHKTTALGRSVVLKFLDRSPELQQDDILYVDDSVMIVVDILPCDAIVINPATAQEMAWISYEIGNKHLPLFIEEGLLLIPFDAPVFTILQASGINITRKTTKLLHQLKTSVSPHTHGAGESLLSRIVKLTTHD